MMDKLSDGLAALNKTLTRKRSGWHWHENAETGALALFPNVPTYTAGSPEQIKLERESESRALAMHAKQELVLPEPKPTENSLQERKRIARGD